MTSKRPGILTHIAQHATSNGHTVRKQADGPNGMRPIDLTISRGDGRPLALQTMRHDLTDDAARRYEEWTNENGAELIWLGPHTPVADIERRISSDDADTTLYGDSGWVGIDAWHGRIRIPVDRRTGLARYDGAWHSGKELCDILLTGGLYLASHPQPYYLRLIRMDCWKCERSILAWLCPDGDLWAKGWREEQRFERIIWDWAAKRMPDARPCSIVPRFAESVGGEYQAFTCPRCWALQGDWFIGSADPSTVLVLADSRVEPWLVSHSDARGCGDGGDVADVDVWALRRERARRVRAMSERLEAVRSAV